VGTTLALVKYSPAFSLMWDMSRVTLVYGSSVSVGRCTVPMPTSTILPCTPRVGGRTTPSLYGSRSSALR